jgi:hypothetical protein
MLKNHGVDDDAMMLMNLSVVVDLFFFLLNSVGIDGDW